jgi:hypothetical protein
MLRLMPRSPRTVARLLAAAATVLSAGCARKEVWFTPNLGSPDMVELFTKPEQWQQARGHIDVFKFYEAQVLSPDQLPCAGCSGNRLEPLAGAGAFARLRQWKIAIALEVGVLKQDWSCDVGYAAAIAEEAVQNVQARGGSVNALAMDEPLLGAEACGLSIDQRVEATAAFAQRLRGLNPGLRVGDIEPYPFYDPATLVSWLQLLRERNAGLAFLHLDVDRLHAARIGADVRGDIRGLKDRSESLGVPFGVIVWAEGASDADYYADALAWDGTVSGTMGQPEQLVFQSWAQSADGSQQVPRNLPEDAPFTHTHLVREGLKSFGN